MKKAEYFLSKDLNLKFIFPKFIVVSQTLIVILETQKPSQYLIALIFFLVFFFFAGYTGKICEEETDPCESSPCQNGAKCVGNQTQFRCDCQMGYSGERCQHPMDLCSDSPCKHGICVPQPDGYKCFCRPGKYKYKTNKSSTGGFVVSEENRKKNVFL